MYFVFQLFYSSTLFGSSLYFLTLLNYKLALAKSIANDWTTRAFAIVFAETEPCAVAGVNSGCSEAFCAAGNLLGQSEVKVKSLSCVQLVSSPTDCSQPGSSVHGIFQARILEWVAISFSRSSWPRDWIWVSRIVGIRFTIWATREVWWDRYLDS